MAENKNNNQSGAVSGSTAPAPQKRKNIFLSEISSMDGKQLFDYAVRKVIIPYGKKAVIEILSTYFNTKAPPTASSQTVSQKESYNDYYVDKTVSETPRSSYTRSVYDYEKIVFNRYEDAEAVLSSLKQTLAIYKRVKVADLYELTDKSVMQIDYTYGWKNLDGADIAGGKGSSGLGYQLVLPRAVPLN